MPRFSAFALLFISLAWAAKPMEPLTNYNVILVHGAADNVTDGFECEDAGKEAWKFLADYQSNFDKKKGTDEEENKKEEFPWQIGGSPGMLGSYSRTDRLTYWLDTRIFENSILDVKERIDSSHIYLQRSFTKPAGSPRDNGREIGYSKWKCGGRRSLIEEAQEVKAEGRYNLSAYRSSAENRNKLPPSRNILIAHSMGGGAAQTPPLGLGCLC
jgi:hypothetical protein